jgi:three-Cys-motif partner protein
VAWKESVRTDTPFSKVFIADNIPPVLKACTKRLEPLGAPLIAEAGEALQTIDRIVAQLDPYGLHFTFLDPYKLESLSFKIIQKLAAFRRMDLLMHVSAYDLQLNLRQYMAREHSPLDDFAPGWRGAVDPQTADDNLIRGKILEHWRNLLKGEGLTTAETHPLVVGQDNQKLYWLAFAAKHELALEFWDKIKRIGPEQLKLI